MAFYALELREGDRILTTSAEYASNYIPMRQVADRTGAAVVVVPDDEHGQVDVGRLAAMLDERVKLVSLVHVPSQGGLVQPAAAVGAACRAAGVPLLLDACQSVGQMPVDVGEIGCDMLSATGRKFLRGPRGTGFLYVRRELVEGLEPPLLDLHAAEWQPDGSYTIRPDARRFENWETNVATKIGLGVAADYALDVGLEPIRDRVRALAGDLRARLAALPGVTVHDRGEELGAIVTFAVEGRPTADVVERPASGGREHLALPRHLRAARLRRPRPHRPRARLAALLQRPRGHRPPGRRALNVNGGWVGMGFETPRRPRMSPRVR